MPPYLQRLEPSSHRRWSVGPMCRCNTLLAHGVVQTSETVILYSTGPEELPVQYSNSRGSQDTHGDGPQLHRHPEESL